MSNNFPCSCNCLWSRFQDNGIACSKCGADSAHRYCVWEVPWRHYQNSSEWCWFSKILCSCRIKTSKVNRFCNLWICFSNSLSSITRHDSNSFGSRFLHHSGCSEENFCALFNWEGAPSGLCPFCSCNRAIYIASAAYWIVIPNLSIIWRVSALFLFFSKDFFTVDNKRDLLIFNSSYLFDCFLYGGNEIRFGGVRIWFVFKCQSCYLTMLDMAQSFSCNCVAFCNWL